MKLSISMVVVAILMTYYVQRSTATCLDTTTSCPKYLHLCSNSNVRKACPLTCSACTQDSCLVDNGGCMHRCNSSGPAARCECFKGFKLAADGKTCVDIDECTEGPDPCFIGLPAFCVNLVGSYTCQPYKCKAPGQMNYYKNKNCCRATNGQCGTNPSIRDNYMETRKDSMASPTDERVFGGTEAVASAWPWMAQITYRGNHHCGGSLLTSKWVVSAAHCFGTTSYTHMFVYLGQTRSANLRGLDNTHKVQRTIVQLINHANYTQFFENDIALLRLNAAVKLNDAITPVCLPCGEVPEVGVKCWVTGFGLTESSGTSPSQKLLEVDVPIVDSNKCVNAYSGSARVYPDKMICAGYDQGKKDACQGDSGGPMACQRADSCEWYLAGLVSFGKGCAQAGYYGVYTNVLNYEAWIRAMLGKDADGLCTRIYNGCKGLSDVDRDCEKKLDRCTSYPDYMGANCRLSCCRLKNGEISNCFDDSGFGEICQQYSTTCQNPQTKKFMQEHCKKTCGYC